MRKSAAIGLGFLLAGGAVWAQQYLITTVAGGVLPPTPAPAVGVAVTARSVATDAAGNVYFSSGNCVFKVDASGVLTRVAGSSAVAGYSGDGGPATSARLNYPLGLAVDAAGNLYIADAANYAVRKVAATGIITTVAGNGTSGYSGDGGPATSAELIGPQGIAVDASGNLYIADSFFTVLPAQPLPAFNSAIRKVTAATGIITTVAGNGSPGYSGDGGPATSAQLSPAGVAVDAAGNLYIADRYNCIRRVVAATGIITTIAGNGTLGFSGDGGPATSAQLGSPESVVVDAAGNLFIADNNNNRVREVAAATGIITTIAGSGPAPGLAAPPSPDSGDGGPATSAQIPSPNGVALDPSGNLYISDGLIRMVAASTGIITTVAGLAPRQAAYSGDGGPATSAQILRPRGPAVDSSGNLYFADWSGQRIRKVAMATGIITTVAGTGIQGLSGDGGPATSAQLSQPGAVALDGSGNLYIAEGLGIRKVSGATGIITTVAGNGTVGRSGDGGPATSAQLGFPRSVAVDGLGNIYIADTAVTIREVVAATGIITTVAGNGSAGYSGDGGPATSAQLGTPNGVAVDGACNLYIGDLNNVIRKVTAATGIITTVAGNGTRGYSGDGGPATSAQLSGPLGVAVDGAGNLYIADGNNARVRKVTAATGIITTIAGNGIFGYSGDGGPATSAQLGPGAGVAVDTAGNVYVPDGNGSVVRMLTPQGTSALLGLATTPSANFFEPGQTGATYSIVVSNNAGAGPTTGTVTMTETVPAGLTLVSMAGAGWNCSGATCTRGDALAPGSSYPAVVVTVNVAPDAPSGAMNYVLVVGGGAPAVSSTLAMWILGPPAQPVLASPADGAADVLVAPTLTWGSVAGPTSYDVYFGTSSPPPQVLTTTSTTYTPGTLNAETTYYWQIAARNDVGATSSAIWSFTTGVPPIGTRFVPVPPCRLADTRGPAGTFGGPSMAAGSTRLFPVPRGACGIPVTAQAYSVNVTAVPAGPLSFLTLWPSGQAQPFVSTLNSLDGSVVANAAIVPAGSGGAVNVFVSNQADVILDINGYFDYFGAAFYAATPCRVADTRRPTGAFGGPALFGGQTRDFPITSGFCAIPPTATAYSLNVTAVPQAGFLGYLTTWPTGPSRPPVSTLNSWTGEVVANAAIVPAGTNQSISVFATDPTDVILDLNGYFGPSVGQGALAFYPVPPCRVADTRYPDGPFGGPELAAQSVRSFAIPASGCPIPSTAAAYSVNVTVVPDGPLSYLTAWATGSPQPFVSTLNSLDGAVVANAAIVPAGTNGAISIYVTNRTHVILDINGYFGQ